MKKIISIMLSVCIMITAISVGFVASFAATGTSIPGSTLTWSYSSNVLTFHGDGVIPDYTVDEITNKPNYPWYNLQYKSIVFSDGVSGIGNNAFAYSPSLESVTIPSTVTALGKNIFSHCEKLNNADIKMSAGTLPESIFTNCSALTKVNFADGITKIDDKAFYSCSALESVAFPSTLTSIGNDVFYTCGKLNNVVFPNPLKSIGDYAFYLCRTLSSVTFGSGLEYIGKSAFRKCQALETIVLPTNLKEIDERAFFSCSALKSLTLPDSLDIISTEAFYDCGSLKSVLISYFTSEIESKAFGYITSLTQTADFKIIGFDGTAAESYAGANKITFESLGSYYNGSCGEGISWEFDPATGVLSITGDGTMVDHSADKLPAYNRFANSIKSISIADTVKLGKFAFADLPCGEKAVWGFDVETGTLTISGSGAMADYSAESLPLYTCLKDKIKSISLADGITEIGSYDFYNISPNGMIIPEAITKIGEKALGLYTDGTLNADFGIKGYKGTAAETYATNNKINFEDITPPYEGKCGETVTWKYNKTTKILSIEGTGATDSFTVDSLPEFTKHNFVIEEITVSNGITELGNALLSVGKGVKKITIGKDITKLGTNAFGFYATVKEGETPSLEFTACESIDVYGYDETPVKDYAENLKFTYTSLNVKEFPELVIGTDYTSKVDKENRIIYFYNIGVSSAAFIDKLPEDTFTATAIADNEIKTGSELTLTANDETKVFTFILLGDTTADGTVNSADALNILQHSVGSALLTGNSLKAGNVNGDENINSADALAVLQVSVGSTELSSYCTK